MALFKFGEKAVKHVLHREPLDREAATRKHDFLLMSSFERRRDAFTLIEMNGQKCASRQLFRLHTYDRPQKKIAGAVE
jgi:hypothetical protein